MRITIHIRDQDLPELVRRFSLRIAIASATVHALDYRDLIVKEVVGEVIRQRPDLLPAEAEKETP